jgi:hypothetical protein
MAAVIQKKNVMAAVIQKKKCNGCRCQEMT